MTFPKHHDITDESRIYQHWRESGFFSPEKTAHYRAAHDRINRDESYTIMLPPPNVTGKLHVGHAMMVAVEDVLVRHARMQ
jgi:valyl-tRNA synthetase